MANKRDDAKPDTTALDAMPRAERDTIDLNNETAGRETGRVKRFLTQETHDRITGEDRKKEHAFNALMRLLLDPNYARAYYRAENAIDRAEEAIARAREELARRAAFTGERLKAMREQAAELPDGTKVYRAADGRFFTEEGRDVTEHKDSIRGLSEHSTRWEELSREKAEEENIEAESREVDAYEESVIKPARQRIDDADHPYSQEELENLPDDIESATPAPIRKHLNPIAAAEAPPPSGHSAADEYFGSSKLNAPDIKADFKAASRDDPYGSSATALPTSKPTLS